MFQRFHCFQSRQPSVVAAFHVESSFNFLSECRTINLSDYNVTEKFVFENLTNIK